MRRHDGSFLELGGHLVLKAFARYFSLNQQHFMRRQTAHFPSGIFITIIRFLSHASAAKFHPWPTVPVQKLPEIHHMPDDAEYWLDRLFVQIVIGASVFRYQLMRPILMTAPVS